MSNLPKEIHNNTAVGGIVFEQTTFRDWCTSNGLDPDRLNGYAFSMKCTTFPMRTGTRPSNRITPMRS